MLAEHALVGGERGPRLATPREVVGVGDELAGGAQATRIARLGAAPRGRRGRAARGGREQQERSDPPEAPRGVSHPATPATPATAATGATGAFGIVTVKQLPVPSSDRTPTVPPWASTKPFTTARPRPMPFRGPWAWR